MMDKTTVSFILLPFSQPLLVVNCLVLLITYFSLSIWIFRFSFISGTFFSDICLWIILILFSILYLMEANYFYQLLYFIFNYFILYFTVISRLFSKLLLEFQTIVILLLMVSNSFYCEKQTSSFHSAISR